VPHGTWGRIRKGSRKAGIEPVPRRGTASRAGPGTVCVGYCLTDFSFRAESSPGPAAEIGRKILSQIPTRFGRLVFLCSLRDRLTGRYQHPSLVEFAGREIADRTLCNQHHQIFTEWIGLNLSDQKADLDEYLRTSRLRSQELSYRELAPATAHEVERQLYLTDLEVLLQLLSFEDGGAFAPPEASPRR
jgi:hypothetical protein